jgi:predicted nucleic acid-binding protein
MTAPEFLDTNVLVYAYDLSEPRKRQIAQSLVVRAIVGEFIISVQVLAEFAAAMLQKVAPPPRMENVLAALDALCAIKVVQPDGEIVRRAVQAREQYGVHFYDGMILAAAERGGCARIWSEDFNRGQEYFGIVVENPFR